MMMLILINFVKFLKVLFADFPNTKFWFPEFFSSYAWHRTCYIPNIKALGLVVSDKKIFSHFPIKAYVKHVTPGAGPFLAPRVLF